MAFEFLQASSVDFKDGVGIADPADQNNPCTSLLLGGRGYQPLSGQWDQDIGINLNGPGFGISKLSPPLSPTFVPSGPPEYTNWIPNSAGIPLGLSCPLPGSPTPSGDHTLWLIWSGMNWRSIEGHSITLINLCTQNIVRSRSPGCLA
ncbi:MAG: hypothetical protein LC620_02900, partial [Halobacteriales archaeon]|nr:hypothetical protein [Halobacteriales archaeon]